MPSMALGSELPGLPPGAMLGSWCVRSVKEGGPDQVTMTVRSGLWGTHQAPAAGS